MSREATEEEVTEEIIGEVEFIVCFNFSTTSDINEIRTVFFIVCIMAHFVYLRLDYLILTIRALYATTFVFLYLVVFVLKHKNISTFLSENNNKSIKCSLFYLKY